MTDEGDDFDPLDPEATSSGVEGLTATDAEQYATRMRMLAGDETGVDVAERLRFHAERGWQSPVSVSAPLMAEAAALIERLRAQVAALDKINAGMHAAVSAFMGSEEAS